MRSAIISLEKAILGDNYGDFYDFHEEMIRSQRKADSDYSEDVLRDNLRAVSLEDWGIDVEGYMTHSEEIMSLYDSRSSLSEEDRRRIVVHKVILEDVKEHVKYTEDNRLFELEFYKENPHLIPVE